MTLKIFDTKATIFSKNKAFKNWENHNFIYKKFAKIFFQKIIEVNSNFKNILLITSDSEELLNEIKNLKFENLIVLSEFEFLQSKKNYNNNVSKLIGNFFPMPIKGKYDLIISNLCLHRIDDIYKLGIQIKGLLNKNGVFFCSYFGGKTLIELRNSFIRCDEILKKKVHQRIIPYIDMIDAGNIFSKIGFKEIVSDIASFNIKYNSVYDLLMDIKGIGENNCLLKRNKSLTTKNLINGVNDAYFKYYSDSQKKLKATCEIISLTMWGN